MEFFLGLAGIALIIVAIGFADYLSNKHLSNSEQNDAEYDTTDDDSSTVR